MCLDVEGQLLYVLGRYLDPASRAQLGDSTHSLTIPVSVTGKGEEGREEGEKSVRGYDDLLHA